MMNTNEIDRDQTDDEALFDGISDEALEVAAGTTRGAFSQFPLMDSNCC